MNSQYRNVRSRRLTALFLALLGVPTLAVQIAAAETNDLTVYNRGVAHVLKREWKAAISDLSVVLAANPTNSLAYEYRGTAYFALGDLDKAISDQTRAIQLD